MSHNNNKHTNSAREISRSVRHPGKGEVKRQTVKTGAELTCYETEPNRSSSVRPLTSVWCDFISLYRVERFQIRTWHEHSSREWEVLKRFSRSEVKCQGHMCRNVTAVMAEGYISISFRRCGVCMVYVLRGSSGLNALLIMEGKISGV